MVVGKVSRKVEKEATRETKYAAPKVEAERAAWKAEEDARREAKHAIWTTGADRSALRVEEDIRRVTREAAFTAKCVTWLSERKTLEDTWLRERRAEYMGDAVA